MILWWKNLEKKKKGVKVVIIEEKRWCGGEFRN